MNNVLGIKSLKDLIKFFIKLGLAFDHLHGHLQDTETIFLKYEKIS